MSITKQDALDYHIQGGRPGKITVVPTKPLETQRDLSLAYSPGVADVVIAIDENPEDAFKYTARGNLVAVISNGTAILGLGNRGALASKPVMEGKGVLFKKFADIDVFDIEVDAEDAEHLINVCKAIAPTFGGINLEDIKAPEAFEVERRLKAELDIPVFHDDQHGTAIISGAGLINALELVGKSREDVKVVVSGAGASAIATTTFYVSLGVKRENIIMCDIHGVIYKGRTVDMFPEKEAFATSSDVRTLEEAIVGADVFLGLSVANVLTADMVRTMAPNPIIFALANPSPEIPYEIAKAARPDAIIATGRSDYPNQVNNVLGFPFLFRGALDVNATSINEPMKIAAAHALAALAKEDVPDSVLDAYGVKSLKFGREYIIPTPFDPRVIIWECVAVAKAAMESGVARKTIDLDQYRLELGRRMGGRGSEVKQRILNKAKKSPKRIVFAEGEEPKIIRAAARIESLEIGSTILLGKAKTIKQKIKDLGLDFKPTIVHPKKSELAASYSKKLFEKRQRHGMTLKMAEERIYDRNNYFGLMMVNEGDADVFLSGLTTRYPDVVRPALKMFGTSRGVQRAIGLYIIIANDRVYFLTDTTVNIQQSAETLAEAAILTADFAKRLEIDPQVAMISFSNFGSVAHKYATKVKEAVQIVHTKRPDIKIDGEMQADVALNPALMQELYPFSEIQEANVLVFSNLDTANAAYKLLSTIGGAEKIGPILLGIDAPVHVLQAADPVSEIVSMAAVAVMDANTRG